MCYLSKIGRELVSTDAPMLQMSANKKHDSRAAMWSPATCCGCNRP